MSKPLNLICPRCGAKRGEPCIGTRGLRKQNHQARLDVAIRLSKRPPDLRFGG